jgi:hypothetical protein
LHACRAQNDELKTFEAGGKYADENAAAYKRSLAAIDAHLDRTWAEQQGRLEASRAALAGEVRRQAARGRWHCLDAPRTARLQAITHGVRHTTCLSCQLAPLRFL